MSIWNLPFLLDFNDSSALHIGKDNKDGRKGPERQPMWVTGAVNYCKERYMNVLTLTLLKSRQQNLHLQI